MHVPEHGGPGRKGLWGGMAALGEGEGEGEDCNCKERMGGFKRDATPLSQEEEERAKDLRRGYSTLWDYPTE